jgi:hypothetical protein
MQVLYYAIVMCHSIISTWNDYTDWCPAASSFDTEIRAIEKAIEIITSKPSPTCAHLFCNNKAAANAIFNFDVKSNQMVIVRINMLLRKWLSASTNKFRYNKKSAVTAWSCHLVLL